MLACNGAYGNSGDSYGGTSLTLDEAVTDIECPDYSIRSPNRIWATEYVAFVENATDPTLDASRWMAGGCVPSICPRAGTS